MFTIIDEITMLIACGTVIFMIGFMFWALITEKIYDIKRENKIKLNKGRRDQLIKEMKVGTYNREKAFEMMEELYDVLHECGDLVIHVCIAMPPVNGLYKLNELEVNYDSWI